MEDSKLIDIGQYPEIYADGIGDLHFLKYNIRIIFFAWHKIDGIYRRAITGTVARPKEAFTPEMIVGLRSGLQTPLYQPEEMRMH